MADGEAESTGRMYWAKLIVCANRANQAEVFVLAAGLG